MILLLFAIVVRLSRFSFRSINDLFVQCASSVEHAFIGLLVTFLVYVLFYDWLFTEWSVYPLIDPFCSDFVSSCVVWFMPFRNSLFPMGMLTLGSLHAGPSWFRRTRFNND